MAKNEPRSASVDSMVDAAAGLITPKASKEVVAGAGNAPAAPVAPAPDPKVAPAAQAVAPQVAPPIVVKSPLGDQSFGGVPVAEVKLTSFEDVAAFAKDYAGIELKTVQDFVPVFNQLKELQKNASEAAKLQKYVDTYKSTLDNLPPDVSLIMSAAINGEDYMPIVQKLQQKAAFDFEKPFESHDELAVINHYTGKNYTKETLDKLEPDVQDTLLDTVKLKYKADQDALTNLRTNTKSAIEKRQNAFRTSVESSINNMLASNPSMDKAAVEVVRQVMTGDLSEALFTKDKTYLPDAAEKIAYMMYGKQIVQAQAQTIGDIVKKMRAEGESQATEKILMRSDQPLLKGSGAPGDRNVIQSIVEKETSFLSAK